MTRRGTGARRQCERGASLVEYALLIALIAFVALFSFRLFGGARDNSLSRSGSTLFGGAIIAPSLTP